MRSSARQLRSNDDLVTLDRFRAESKALEQRAKKLRGEEKREVQELKRLADAKARDTKA